MQNSQNQLKEIIWEITGRCHNGCSYCGSKECWDDEVDANIIVPIIDNIVTYLKNGEVNISGGDPLLVPLSLHTYIIDKLKKSKNKAKLIINLKSLFMNQTHDLVFDEMVEIINLYDVIGISINNLEDISYFQEFRTLIKKPITIITNFNMLNIWDFDSIDNATTLGPDFAWQIQYTMSKEKALTIYTNKSAREFLFEKIANCGRERMILADNMNNGKCSAGSRSLGILSNGDIVPCLSMRSWCDIGKTFQGNLLKESLRDIWEKQFKEYRFCEFECCKDICKAPFENKRKETKTIIGPPGTNWPLPYQPKEIEKPWPRRGEVLLYGVGPVISTPVYSVWDTTAIAYAVSQASYQTSINDFIIKDNNEENNSI